MPQTYAAVPILPKAPPPNVGSAAKTTLSKLWKVDMKAPAAPAPPLPRTSVSRLSDDTSETILYLAYGSNLSAETFKGNRGIRPISAINVHVPSLDLTFDLAGIPYIEPCFANTRYHIPAPPAEDTDYHKDRWTKGLIGVVYEVTPEDYRTIIATEGGGASYLDVVVPCYLLPDGSKTVVSAPEGNSFTAHTLMQPADDETAARTNSRRIHRPDPSYAQPSARYLKLITDGAEEHFLPDEYVAYLHNIRPYTITNAKQRIGQGLIITFFMPMLLFLFGLGKVLADEDGKIPEWLADFMGMFFRMVWGIYDEIMIRAFGDGERTMKRHKKGGNGDKGDEETGLKRLCVFGEKGVRLEGTERALR